MSPAVGGPCPASAHGRPVGCARPCRSGRKTRPGSWPRSRPAETIGTPSAAPPPAPPPPTPVPWEAQRSCGPLRHNFLSKRVEADALGPVPETLAGPALGAERLEQRAQQCWNIGDGDVGGEHSVQARAVEIASEHDVVLAERRADEADVAEIRTRAAVWAAAHPKADALLAQAQLIEQGCELADQARQGALGFGHGEPAGRDGRAGHRVSNGPRNRLHRRDAVLRHQHFDARSVGGLDVGEDHILLGGKSYLRTQLVDDAPQPGTRADITDVGDASVLDVDADVQAPVALLVPAEMVVDRLPGELLWWLELE